MLELTRVRWSHGRARVLRWTNVRISHIPPLSSIGKALMALANPSALPDTSLDWSFRGSPPTHQESMFEQMLNVTYGWCLLGSRTRAIGT